MVDSDKTKFLCVSIEFTEANKMIIVQLEYFLLFFLFQYITFKSIVHRPTLRAPARCAYVRVYESRG